MTTRPSLDELFERRLPFPDPDAMERLGRLVGLDDHKSRLTKILCLLVNPHSLDLWVKKHHHAATDLMNTVLRRPPLVVLAGDVGSGKTELAETIGDAVARQEKIDITLFPLSLSTRGQGRVGEMTQLLSTAFDYTVEHATKLKGTSNKSHGAIILLVDEADAIAQSREAAQMHHEDRAGVNAFIRGIDRIANGDYLLPSSCAPTDRKHLIPPSNGARQTFLSLIVPMTGSVTPLLIGLLNNLDFHRRISTRS